MDGTGDLDTYFSNIGTELLSREREVELAEGIARLEVTAWHALVESKAALARTRATGVEIHGLARFAASGKLSTRARAAAIVELRAADLDREALDKIVGALRKTDAPPTWLARVLAACRESRRLRDEFVKGNLRLVVTMARRYDKGGMPLEDLVQEGNLGLMHAVPRFDPSRGLRFSTYACWWIRHHIGRALADKARVVRVPVHMLDVQQRLDKANHRLTGELGRPPDAEELAAGTKIPIAKVEITRQVRRPSVSLNARLGVRNPDTGLDDDCALVDVVAAEEAKPVVELLADREDAVKLSALLIRSGRNALSEFEVSVLRQRFGLDGCEERTFKEIGDEVGLSRERIRQVQNEALAKLRRGMRRRD